MNKVSGFWSQISRGLRVYLEVEMCVMLQQGVHLTPVTEECWSWGNMMAISGNLKGSRDEEQVSLLSLRECVVTQHRKWIGPWVWEEDSVWGGTSLSDRTNQIAVICHLSSSCTDKPNLPKFFSSNWKTSRLKSRANAFCRVPPSLRTKQRCQNSPHVFPRFRGHRLSSRFEPPALQMKFVFLPLHVILVALVFYRFPLLSCCPRLQLTSQASGSHPAISRMQTHWGEGGTIDAACCWDSERLQKDHVCYV
jgi:hypothetical protein